MKSEKWKSYEEYLKSPEWSKLRAMALDRALHRCQICNSSVKLHVHHRVYDSPWGEENTNDLTVLCQSCHALFHSKETDIRSAQKMLKKAENILKDAARYGTGKKKKKKKGPESSRAKTVRLSGPVRAFCNFDIAEYERQSLAEMETIKKRKAANLSAHCHK